MKSQESKLNSKTMGITEWILLVIVGVALVTLFRDRVLVPEETTNWQYYWVDGYTGPPQ